MSWRKDEDILLINLNNLPNYDKYMTLMKKQYNMNIAIPKAQGLFIKRVIQWIDSYIYIIDTNNDIHIQLLIGYMFYFFIQYSTKDFINQVDMLLLKYKLSVNDLVYKYLFIHL